MRCHSYRTRSVAERAVRYWKIKWPDCDWFVTIHPFDQFRYALAYISDTGKVYLGR